MLTVKEAGMSCKNMLCALARRRCQRPEEANDYNSSSYRIKDIARITKSL
jgi:hypothetical protein